VNLPYGFGTGVVTDPDALTTYAPAVAAGAYGLDPIILTTFSSVAEIDEVKLNTRSLRALAQNTGTFEPNGTTAPEKITALVAVPDPAKVTGTCPDPTPLGGTAYTAGKCAPLVVFAHGLQGSKTEMLALAATFTNAGFVVAAFDAEMHGERSYCTSNAQCVGGSTCRFYANLQTSVDPPIGFCEFAPGVRGLYASYRADCATPFTGVDANGNPIPNTAPGCVSLTAKGTSYVSGNRLLTLNFFRVRDALRQNIIDTSAVVKAIAPVGKSTDAFASWLEAGYGLAVDFSKVYYVGHSYGAIHGIASVAANPRVGSLVDIAGGATSIDVFANPESHYNSVFTGLLAGAGIFPGTPDYLKFVQIGKWILDPADPANFARFTTSNTLGTLPPSFPAPATRPALAQLSLCDATVPNAQNTYLASQLGLTVPDPASTTSGRVQWFMQTGAASCPADGVSHSLVADFSIPSLTYKLQGNAAAFLQSVAAGAPINVTTPVLP
jgi:pimeloyl-ACP methyl ester carboxylesterase